MLRIRLAIIDFSAKSGEIAERLAKKIGRTVKFVRRIVAMKMAKKPKSYNVDELGI